MISFYKTRETEYFQYNDNIKIKYLSLRKMRESTNKYINFIFRLWKKIYETLILKYRIKKVTKKITKEDIIICGRVEVALKIMEHLKYYKKLIVRDAIHYYYFGKKTQKRMKKKFPSKVNTFIVSSNESLNKYNEIFGSSSMKMKKIYNPLGIVPKVQYNFDNKTIIAVGRYDKQKGFENLIKAFDDVYTKYPDWNLNIIGNNDDDELLKRIIKPLKSKDNIHLVKNNRNIVEELHKASMFVMPSRYEGYANALVEALSCGIPAISFNWLLGVEEIIKDNVNGKIVKLEDRYKYAQEIDNEKDIKKLFNAIIELIEDKEKCENMSREAPKITESRDKDKIIQEWIDIINIE